jgi:flagellar assembly protein FliH
MDFHNGVAMGTLAPPVRPRDKGPVLVLRKAQLAPQVVVVGAPRKNPAPAVPAAEPPPPAPVQAAPQIDHQALLEAARRDAYEAGYAEGAAKGLAEGDEKAKRAAAERRAELDRIAASVERAHGEALASIEDVALGVAWEALCKILGDTIATPEGIQALVRQCANQARAEEKISIRLCPADLELLREGGHEPQNEARQIEFVADPTIEMGGCIVETAAGSIDGKLDTQLARLRDTLLAIRRSRQNQGPRP